MLVAPIGTHFFAILVSNGSLGVGFVVPIVGRDENFRQRIGRKLLEGTGECLCCWILELKRIPMLHNGLHTTFLEFGIFGFASG